MKTTTIDSGYDTFTEGVDDLDNREFQLVKLSATGTAVLPTAATDIVIGSIYNKESNQGNVGVGLLSKEGTLKVIQ